MLLYIVLILTISSSQDHREEEIKEDMDIDPHLSNKDKLGTIYLCISLLDLSNLIHVVAHKVL